MNSENNLAVVYVHLIICCCSFLWKMKLQYCAQNQGEFLWLCILTAESPTFAV